MKSNTAKKSSTEKQTERAEAIEHLCSNYLKVGDTVYAILRHVGRTGMSRYIDLYVMKNNQPLRITWSVAEALDIRYNRRHEALRIGGGGFDVAHDTVRNLAWRLFGNADSLTHRWI